MEGYLHLQSGQSYKGKWLTAPPAENIKGEIVFFTGMTGYQEVLTDPSYKDQIIVFTYPLIGNYGINEADFESKQPHAAAVIVYEGREQPSHYQAAYSLKDYLNKWDIPLLSHIDTRSVVKKIRSEGTMPAVVSAVEQIDQDNFMLSAGKKAAGVSVISSEQQGEGDTHIVLMDFGAKKSIAGSLIERNCTVTTVPYNTTFDEVAAINPDGILLSNGPGDPKDLQEILPAIKKLLNHYPTLGICLGHQLAALALGADTKKLSFGHRGANHPVADLQKGIVYMSSQNHSYVVDESSLAGTGLKTRYINLHDQSIEGLSHETLPLQTVQFHPEAHPGPADAAYIFDEFLMMIKAEKRSVFSYA